MNAPANACRNCESPLDETQHFCRECGQRADTGRLTMRHIGHEVLYALTHANHSIFALIKALSYRPGHVARDYVEGRRKKYFGPFPFLVISVGITSFMIVVTGVHFFAPIPDSRVAGFLQRHVNLVILVQMPLLAGWTTLLFWNSRINFAENLVLGAYTSGFRILFLGLVTTPIMYFAKLAPGNLAVAPFYYGLWFLYFAVAAAQFYRGNVLWTVSRAVAACALAQVCTIFVIYLFIIAFTAIAGP